MGRDYYGYKPYVPVAKRRAQAAQLVASRLKKGLPVSAVRIEGRTIASTFWGRAWCTNLESYSDYANRLPRGRTYVRNGSVVHLSIDKGRIEALVSGSELYKIQIDIDALPQPHWRALKAESAGKMGTLVELLQGKLSKAMMELVTGREHGLFPKPKEIKMRCSCPDGAYMCKHLAAVLYGVGNRLDSSPELLFVLRGVDHLELIEQAIPTAPIRTKGNTPTLATDDLGAIFDIEIGDAPASKAAASTREKPAAKPTGKKAGAGRKVAATKAAATISEKPAAKPTAQKARAVVTKKAAASIREKPAAKPAVTKARAEKNATVTKKAKAKPVPKKL
jgi:uncharacterized Zn finger protein